MMIPRLTIRVSKTADGKQDYMQITSEDQFAINIVLVAPEILIEDAREPEGTSP